MNGIYIADLGDAVASLAPRAARDVARRAIEDMLRCLLPEANLLHDGRGAPYLDGADAYLSVSHSGTLAVLALCRAMRVGVDVEATVLEDARAARLEQKYLTHIGDEKPSASFPLPLYLWKKSGENANNSFPFEEICANPPEDNTPAEATVRRFTQLEAVLKLSGEGFAAFPRIRELWQGACVTSASVNSRSGTLYVLSLATPRGFDDPNKTT